jgi:hypothetical protein
MKALPTWIECELANPLAEGEGRNNQMIKVAPTMLRCGWSVEQVFDTFKRIYDLEDDDSKDTEIERVLRSAARYAASDASPLRDGEWQELASLRRDVAHELPNILANYSWPRAQLGCKLSPRQQRAWFIHALFNDDEIVWSGDKHHSGKPHHARHFRPAQEWADGSSAAWPFISQCTFQPGTFSRCNESISTKPYLVVESDTLTHDEALSVFCWLREAQEIPLRAVVFSGKRSLHGWFERPAGHTDRELAAIMAGLRCDPATVKPVQPVRLPGVVRAETGRLQELLYLAGS